MRYLALALALVVGLAVPSAAQDLFTAPPVNLWITGDSFLPSGNYITAVCGTPCFFTLRAPAGSYYALVAFLPETSVLDTGFVFWDGLIPSVGLVSVPGMIPEYMRDCKLVVMAAVITPDARVYWSNSYFVKLI